MHSSSIAPLVFLQEYSISEAQFAALLEGRQQLGCLDQAWAVRKLVEEGAYDDILRFIGLAALVQNWPRWRSWITSPNRQRGLDFLTSYLKVTYPDLYGNPDHG